MADQSQNHVDQPNELINICEKLEVNEGNLQEPLDVSEDNNTGQAFNVNMNIGDRNNTLDDMTQFHEKERELLDMVFTLESEKQQLLEESKSRIYQLRKELDETMIDNEKLKKKVSQLDQMLKQSVALGGGGPPKTKAEQDELLTRAKTLLFEKTKVCKQQETHIATLKAQVDSIKEVLDVTKEMLNLRNTEMDHMQTRLDSANLRIKAEKDRCNLYEKKLAISKNVLNNVKVEHDIQTKIFKELKASYEAKVKALTTALGKSGEK